MIPEIYIYIVGSIISLSFFIYSIVNSIKKRRAKSGNTNNPKPAQE